MPIDPGKLTSLQKAGRTAARIHQEIADRVKPGVNLLDIEHFADQEIKKAGMTAAFKGYKGFPAATCLSVNDEIVHGIPRSYVLENGDILSVDLGVACEGWIVDTAQTHGVGKITPEHQRLLETTRLALEKAIEVCTPGRTLGDIGATIQQTVEENSFFIVRDLTGHGVGRKLQEAPTIYNYGTFGRGQIIKEGMVLAIEPITTAKPTDIAIAADGWTIISRNGAVAAHFEHTIVVTDSKPIVLTA